MEGDTTNSRSSERCLGKLRAINNERDHYVLYDNGEAPSTTNHDHFLRAEHGAFIYRYEMCNVGNIRKMKIMLPQLNYNLEQDINTTDDGHFTIDNYKPKTEAETFMTIFEKN